MQNKKSFLLALIGGLIFIIEDLAGSIGFFANLALLGEIPEFVVLIPIINAIIWILTIIAISGGIGAILGGFLLTVGRVGTGKFLIGIAVGMGLISLIINIIQLIWLSGAIAVWDFLTISIQSWGFIGVILTILARQTARTDEI